MSAEIFTLVRLNTQKQRRRWRLFHEQDRRCFYCEVEMTWGPYGKNGQGLANRSCTLEHLDDKFDPGRGKRGGSRTVAACKSCNLLRAQFRQTMHLLFPEHMGLQRPKQVCQR